MTAVMPIIVLGAIYYYISFTSITNEIEKRNINTLNSISEAFEIILDEITATSLSMTTNYDMTKNLHDIMTTEKMDYYQSISYSYLKSFLNAQTITNSYIESLYIVFEDADSYFFSSSDGIVSAEKYRDASWVSGLDFSQIGQYKSVVTTLDNGSRALSFYYNFSFGSPSSKGTIVLNVKLSYLKNMLRNIIDSDSQIAFIVHNNEILVVSDDTYQSELQEILASSSDFLPAKIAINDKDFIVSEHTSVHGINYYMLNDIHILYSTPRNIMYIVIASSFILTILSCIYLYYLNYRQFVQLNGIIELLNSQSDTTLVTSKNYNEYEHIVSSIKDQHLLQKYFETELSEKNYKQKYFKLIALQSQINPHMLYNTMESIKWKACELTGNYNDVYKMLEYLAQIMRYSLNSADTFVSMGEEIDNTNNYIRLLKMRYPNKYTFIWDYPENIINYKSMRIILQPIIENAVMYGSSELLPSHFIRIRLRISGNMIKVRIFNNGRGISPKQLEAIRTKLQLENPPSKGIGLYNIHHRLKLQYGTELAIVSRVERGTSISFSFPAELMIDDE